MEQKERKAPPQDLPELAPLNRALKNVTDYGPPKKKAVSDEENTEANRPSENT